MASWPEIERFKKDADGARALASRLLIQLKFDGLSDWEIDFLEGIVERAYLGEFSTRQAEKLLEIRDNLVMVSEYRGFSVPGLLRQCFEGRNDLGEEDEAWIEEVYAYSTRAIRRKQANRLLRCAGQLGLIETAA